MVRNSYLKTGVGYKRRLGRAAYDFIITVDSSSLEGQKPTQESRRNWISIILGNLHWQEYLFLGGFGKVHIEISSLWRAFLKDICYGPQIIVTSNMLSKGQKMIQKLKRQGFTKETYLQLSTFKRRIF